MHELSIAESILDIVEQYVDAADRVRVRDVTVRVGEMSGVVPDSLEFCFSAITANSAFGSARLHIEEIPFMIECPTCGQVAASPSGFVLCPRCGGVAGKVISGTELHVAEIELEDATEVT